MRLTFPFKLVRDKIPAIIEAKGGACIVRQLTAEQYAVALRRKLVEESRAVLKAKSKEELTSELADLLDVAETIRLINMIAIQDLEYARRTKTTKAGGFTEGKLLVFAYGND